MFTKKVCPAWAILFLFFLVVHGQSFADEEFDMEDIAQDFIVDTHQIVIPNFPHAFNPSVVRWNGRLLLSFRVIDETGCIKKAAVARQKKANGKYLVETLLANMPSENPMGSGYLDAGSYVGLIWLDDDFRPLGKPQILPLDDYIAKKHYARSEDARLITVGDRLFLTYSSNNNEVVTEGGFRMYVAELEFNGKELEIVHNERLVEFDGEDSERREKNWVPFDYQGRLCFAYMLAPHRILMPYLDGTGKCKTLCTSRGSIVWEWGELRGGTPALFDEEIGEYLAFYHSCTMMTSALHPCEKVLHYFMGAYTYSADPPFKITRISPEPIVGKGFYWGKEYAPYWQPVRVVFPCGYFIDGPYVWITYGRQDHELWVVKIDKKGLYESLIQVTTRSGK